MQKSPSENLAIQNMVEKGKNISTEGSGSTSDSGESSESDHAVKLEDLKGFEEGFRSKFAPYREIINNLTKRQNIETEQDIIFCDISLDSTRILLVLMEDDENYFVS